MSLVPPELLLMLACILLRWNVLGAEAKIRGTPGKDYPNYFVIPQTSFRCSDQEHNPGLYADMETRCQVFHYCYEHRQESFLCPLGTIFNQPLLSCDYWYSSNCSLASTYYDVNNKRDNFDVTMGGYTPSRQKKSNQLFDKMASLYNVDDVARAGSHGQEDGNEAVSNDESTSVSSAVEDFTTVAPNGLEHDGNSSSDGMSATFTQYNELENADDLVLSDDGTLMPNEQYTDVSESEQYEETDDVYNEQDTSDFDKALQISGSESSHEVDLQTEEESSIVPYEQGEASENYYPSSDDYMATYSDEPDSDFLKRSVHGGNIPKPRRRRPIYVIPDSSIEKTEIPQLTSPAPEEHISIIGVDGYDNRYLVQDIPSSDEVVNNNMAPDTSSLIDTISYINGFEGPQEKNQKLYYDVSQRLSEKYPNDVYNERPNLVFYDGMNTVSEGETQEKSVEGISPEDPVFSSLESAFEQGTIRNLRDGIFYPNDIRESPDVVEEENFNTYNGKTDININNEFEGSGDEDDSESDLPSNEKEAQEYDSSWNSENAVYETEPNLESNSNENHELDTYQEAEEITGFSTIREGIPSEDIADEITEEHEHYPEGSYFYQNPENVEDLGEYQHPNQENNDQKMVENSNIKNAQNMDVNGELYQEVYIDSESEKSYAEDSVENGQMVDIETLQLEASDFTNGMDSTDENEIYQPVGEVDHFEPSQQAYEEDEKVRHVVQNMESNSVSDDQEVEYITMEEYEKLSKEHSNFKDEEENGVEYVYYYETPDGQKIEVPSNEYLNENNLPEGYMWEDSDHSQFQSEEVSDLSSEQSEISDESEDNKVDQEIEDEVKMDPDSNTKNENNSIAGIQSVLLENELKTDHGTESEEEMSSEDEALQFTKEHDVQKLSVENPILQHKSQEILNNSKKDVTSNSIAGGPIMESNVFDTQLQDFNPQSINISAGSVEKHNDITKNNFIPSKTVPEVNVPDKKPRIERKPTTTQRGKSARSLTSSNQKGSFNAPGVEESLFNPAAFGEGIASPYSEFNSFEFQNAKAAYSEPSFSSPQSSKLASIVKNLLSSKKSKLKSFKKYFGSK